MTTSTRHSDSYLTTIPGKPVSHSFAKELLAGFVGGEVDKLAETKGMDYYDKEKVSSRPMSLLLHLKPENRFISAASPPWSLLKTPSLLSLYPPLPCQPV